ncbi:MAG: SGNH/GDSL hydrolase family protein [Beijerinckiaceae bacterium]
MAVTSSCKLTRDTFLRPLLLAAAVVASAVSASAAPLTDPICLKARQTAFDAAPAPMLERQPQTIVAIGSSSTEGISRNARDMLYPAALETALKKRWPQADLKVFNKGRGGEVMAETLKRFEADVIALKPSLVIWQLGVNDVLRYQGVEGRMDEIKAGLRMLAERNIPVILLDLQYAPIVIRDPDAGPMQELINGAAREGVRGRVFHFKRFAIMKELAEAQAVSHADMTDQDGLHMTDAMHMCVGSLLAEMITATPVPAAAQAPQSAQISVRRP